MSIGTSTVVMGNFTDPNALLHAAEKIRDSGFRKFDVFTPYPVHGLDGAMGIKRTILPYISFAGAMFGLSNALFLQFFTGAIDYKLNIGGKPFFGWQFSIPIDFELTILCTALATIGGVFFLSNLPKWHLPFQHDAGFQKAVDDTFVVAISSEDPRYTSDGTKMLLEQLGASDVRIVEPKND